jgi:hypothetical protein
VPPPTATHHDQWSDPVVPRLRRPVGATSGYPVWPAKRADPATEQHDGIELHGLNIASTGDQV